MAELLKGAGAAKEILERAASDVRQLAASGVVPGLAVLRVGEAPDDIAYERSILKKCETAGVAVTQVVLSQQATTEEVLRAVSEINKNKAIHGALILRPMPKSIDDDAVCAALDAAKDLDGITPGAMASLYMGKKGAAAPCTAEACIALLDHYGIALEGKNVAVVGRSLVIGKPVAMLLIQRNATVTVCHTRTRDLAAVCKRADIIIAAAGVAGMITTDFVAAGQTVLDVGMNVGADGALCGDADPAIAEVVGAVSPVPGGVGAVTSAILVRNTVEAAKRV